MLLLSKLQLRPGVRDKTKENPYHGFAACELQMDVLYHNESIINTEDIIRKKRRSEISCIFLLLLT